MAFANTASHFTGLSIVPDGYYVENGLRQAVADQKQSISQGYVVAALVNNGTHIVLVRGASWSQLSDALLRPQAETMKIHDPAPGTGGIRVRGRGSENGAHVASGSR